MQTAQATTRGGRRLWLFRGMLLAGAALMLVSWFTPWWGARVSDLIIPGNHIAMRPWGVEMIAEVAAYVDSAVYGMPAFFAPLMWLYLAACMAALVVSLFLDKKIFLGQLEFSLPRVLIGIVGLSYLIAVVAAVVIAQWMAGDAGVRFFGSTTVYNPMTGGVSTITGTLRPGYWLAVAAGLVLIALALLRNSIVGRTAA